MIDVLSVLVYVRDFTFAVIYAVENILQIFIKFYFLVLAVNVYVCFVKKTMLVSGEYWHCIFYYIGIIYWSKCSAFSIFMVRKINYH